MFPSVSPEEIAGVLQGWRTGLALWVPGRSSMQREVHEVVRLAVVYTSLVVWHFLFFHQLVVLGTVCVLLWTWPACMPVLLTLVAGKLPCSSMSCFDSHADQGDVHRIPFLLLGWI